MHLTWDLVSKQKRYVKPLLSINQYQFIIGNYFNLLDFNPSNQIGIISIFPLAPPSNINPTAFIIFEISEHRVSILQMIFTSGMIYQLELYDPVENRLVNLGFHFSPWKYKWEIHLSMRSKLLSRINKQGLEKKGVLYDGQMKTTGLQFSLSFNQFHSPIASRNFSCL